MSISTLNISHLGTTNYFNTSSNKKTRKIIYVISFFVYVLLVKLTVFLQIFLNTKLFKMKQNVRKTDKIIRLIIATVLVILNLTGIITGVLSIVFWVIAAMMFFTILTSYCPLYNIFGHSCSCKENSCSTKSKLQ